MFNGLKLHRGDRIRITWKERKKRFFMEGILIGVYPRFIVVDRGNYKETFDTFEIERGHYAVENLGSKAIS